MTNTLCEAQQLLSFPNSVTARNSNSFFRVAKTLFLTGACVGAGAGAREEWERGRGQGGG